MAKSKEKLEAQKLRRKGRSIKAISRELEIAKSTISVWCRDLKLTQIQKERLRKNAIAAGHRGRMRGAETNRRKKEVVVDFYQKKGKKDLNKLSKRDMLLVGLGLYWGEGSKSWKLSFANSDPDVIKFIAEWFYKVMDVKKEELMPRIFINEMHRPRIKSVLRFWSSWLNLPVKQFGSPAFLKMKQKKIYENYHSYYGVLALRVRKSAKLKYRILGLIDALRPK